MSKVTITKMECNLPNPNNPCSHSLGFSVVVEGVTDDERLCEAAEMICASLRQQVAFASKPADGEAVAAPSTESDSPNEAGTSDGEAAEVGDTQDTATEKTATEKSSIDRMREVADNANFLITNDRSVCVSIMACIDELRGVIGGRKPDGELDLNECVAFCKILRKHLALKPVMPSMADELQRLARREHSDAVKCLESDSALYKRLLKFHDDMVREQKRHDTRGYIASLARLIAEFISEPAIVAVSDQYHKCDGKGGCDGECRCHSGVSEPTTVSDQHPECRCHSGAGRPAETGDGVTVPAEDVCDVPTDHAGKEGEPSDRPIDDEPDAASCDERPERRAYLRQPQFIHISLPDGGHVSLPEGYVFFGPARIFENMY